LGGATATKKPQHTYTVIASLPQGNVLGKAWLYIPLFGHVGKLVKTPLGFILCLIVPGALIIWGEGKKIAAIIRSKK